jgi:hypothetical protein
MYDCVEKQNIRNKQVQVISSLNLEDKKAFIVPYYELRDIHEIILPSGLEIQDCIGAVKEYSVAAYANEHGIKTYCRTFENFSNYCKEEKVNIAIIDYHFMATDKTRSSLQAFIRNRVKLPAFISINYYTPREPYTVWDNFDRAEKYVTSEIAKECGFMNGDTRRYECLQLFTIQTILEMGIRCKIKMVESYSNYGPTTMYVIGVHVFA